MNRISLQPVLCLCAALLISSLLLAHLHPFGNPSLFAERRTDDAQSGASLPAGVHAILIEKCADCHGRGLRAPVYGHFAPASWLMERDVIRARTAFDVSQWPDYPADKQEELRSRIAYEARTDRMPPLQYIAIHHSARLTAPEIRIFEAWASGPTNSAASSAPVHTGDGNPARGEVVFEKRCTGCHALANDHEGPRLQDVYGRTAGSVPGFGYSNAMRKSHITWNDQTLDRWLTDPDVMVPGNDMTFRVIRPDERLDVIRYLRQQAGR
jgi:cytochrome c